MFARRIIKVGTGRLEANIDQYNLGSSDAILTQQNVYSLAGWTRQTLVIQPRFVQFTVRYDS